MQNLNYFHINELPSNYNPKKYIKVTDSIFFHKKTIHTKYGSYTEKPDIYELFKILNIKILPFGNNNYNALGFSCQVPNRILYIISEEYQNIIENIPKDFFAFEILHIVPKEIMNIFQTSLEFMMADCLVNQFGFTDQCSNISNASLKIVRKNKILKIQNLCDKNYINYKTFYKTLDNNLIFLSLISSCLQDDTQEYFELLRNKTITIFMAGSKPSVLRGLKKPSYEECKKLVTENAWEIQYVPEKLRNKEISIHALKKDGFTFQFVLDEVKDQDLINEYSLITDASVDISLIPEKYLSDEVIANIVKNDFTKLKEIPSNRLTVEMIKLSFMNSENVREDHFMQTTIKNKSIFKDLLLSNLIEDHKKIIRRHNECPSDLEIIIKSLEEI